MKEPGIWDRKSVEAAVGAPTLLLAGGCATSKLRFADHKKTKAKGMIRNLCGLSTVTAVVLLLLSCARPVLADEGGVSFWLPGSFSSLAATPRKSGFAFATWLFLDQPSGGGNEALAKLLQIGNIPPDLDVMVAGNTTTRLPLVFLNGSYAFPKTIVGGQASVSLTSFCGDNSTTVAAQITGTIPTPEGPVPFTRAVVVSDSVAGCGDLFPQIAEKWNAGNHNYMIYVTGAIPVGAYNSNRIANLGIGHGAIDGGFGYTYFNKDNGHEFSGVLGVTHNYINNSTNYQNGGDMHLDWAASQFVPKTRETEIGVVGYYFQQLGCDGGSGDHVGCFKSRVVSVGPQIAYAFPIGRHMQGYLNLKAYAEFAAENRAHGNNIWLTFAISPRGQTKN